MKKKICILAVAVIFASHCFAKQNLDESLLLVGQDIVLKCPPKEIVAILGFSSETKEMDSYINDQLVSILTDANLRVVTRLHMDKIEKELKFQSSGVVSESTALSIGERLGAHLIIFGSLAELDNKYMLQVKMLDVAHGTYALVKTYEINRSAKTEQLLHHAATVYKSSLGIIAEVNKNSVTYVSPAAGVYFDYNVLRQLSFGIKAAVSYDVADSSNSTISVEPLAFVRWYAVSPSGEPGAGLFVEGQCGPELLFVNSSFHSALSMGLSIGFRIPFEHLYVEPYIRGGFPYLFGAGFGLGVRF